jgi:hypothetical protein
MRALSLALLLMASMAFVLGGCSDNSNSVVTPSEQALATPASSSSLAKGGILHSATGSGHWKSVFFSDQTLIRVAFSAIQHADGTVSGEIEDKDRGPTFKFHGKVIGLKVKNNIAKIEFKFTSGTYFGVPLADYYGGDLSKVVAWVIAIDNGEGKNAEKPDVVSWFLWGDDAELMPILGVGVEYISNLDPQEFMDWVDVSLLPLVGITHDIYFTPVDHGSVQVR